MISKFKCVYGRSNRTKRRENRKEAHTYSKKSMSRAAAYLTFKGKELMPISLSQPADQKRLAPARRRTPFPPFDTHERASHQGCAIQVANS